MEVSEYLVGSPAFKAGDTGDPRMAGSIPVHLRHSLPLSQSVAALLDARRFAGGRLWLGLFVAFVVLLPTPVSAARVLSSTPADGASLSRLEQVEFEFDQLLLPDGAAVTITKFDGETFPVETSVVEERLIGVVVGDLPSGNYEVGYSVRSADGALNEATIRVGINSPEQALSGGLLAVIGISAGLILYLAFVFRADKNRRPTRRQ